MKWLRWIFVCHFGRDCAVFDVHNLRGPWSLPPGYGLVVRWGCPNCGRTYEKKIPMEDIHSGP